MLTQSIHLCEMWIPWNLILWTLLLPPPSTLFSQEKSSDQGHFSFMYFLRFITDWEGVCLWVGVSWGGLSWGRGVFGEGTCTQFLHNLSRNYLDLSKPAWYVNIICLLHHLLKIDGRHFWRFPDLLHTAQYMYNKLCIVK